MKIELIIFIVIIFTFGIPLASSNDNNFVVSPEDESLVSYVSNYYLSDPLENSLASNISDRDNRVVSSVRIFIPAGSCSTGLADRSEGYCDGIASCLSYVGRITGFCTSGLGVCCLVTKRCGRTIANRIAYFTNQGYTVPKLNKSPCVVTVRQYKDSVLLQRTVQGPTQLRLDFINLNLQQPTPAGVCQKERLVITGQAATLTVPVLCGTLTGSHIYVHYTAAGGPVKINVSLNDVSTPFVIKVTQILPGEEIEAPAGCLQYYNTPTGMVESFNYEGNILLGISYKFCLPSTLKSVVWTEDPADPINFAPPGSTTCTSDFLTFMDVVISGMKQNSINICNNFPSGGIESWSNMVMYTHNAKGLVDDLSYRTRWKLLYDAVF